MPNTETLIIALTSNLQAAENGRTAAAQAGGDVEPMEQTDQGHFLVKARFSTSAAAYEFESVLAKVGFSTWHFLTAQAVLSWIGRDGYVQVAVPNGGSITFRGTIQSVPGDDTKIRIIPRVELGGFDLGPSTYGSPNASDSLIDHVIQITPL